MTIGRTFLTIGISLTLPLAPASRGTAADLRPQTVAAFKSIRRRTEQQREASLTAASSFLWVESQPTATQKVGLEQLRAGTFVIERLTTTATERGSRRRTASSITGSAPCLSPVRRSIRRLRSCRTTITTPRSTRRRSTKFKVLARDGDSFRVLLRFFMKKVLTVVVDGEHQARFTRLAPDRAHSRVVSTRLNEVEDPGTAQERLKPEGRDGGYLWRINWYWRFLERDGGIYIQCETITLSRRIPIGLGWLVGPFVTSIPKDLSNSR